MTLSELADQITTKLSDTDSASVVTCKKFINNRYRMVWESQLWTQTLGVVSASVSANDETVTLSGDPTIFYYPTSTTTASTAPRLDFVVAAKFTETGKDEGHEISGQNWIQFFQLDPNIWNNTADRRTTPVNFTPLPKDASGNCRIKPIPTPNAAGTVYALGKLKNTDLGDSDSPVIPGVDNVLLAYAEGDMLERSMQYSKAQLKFTEATTLLQISRELDNVQQNKVSVIVPDVPAHWSRNDFIIN